ncbi:MAG: CPBP family intramembrane metalloprotease [Bacteroidia bacterium]|nr:CPBP family intramembrane metalloprotease [Bacteroidia bacterium]MCX7651592.1 CPBP family intramembrane metalloprotease [Bacteroidia bacterium]MDW8417743.1 CPBP family intramembrane glutamic endopeptidase [Bacteroidia bacterium]
MRELLRLAGLLLLLGLTMMASGLILAFLGFTPQVVSSADTAFQTAAGNALALLIGFGGAGLLYLLLIGGRNSWSQLRSFGASGQVYAIISLFMFGLFLVLPWLSLDAESFSLPPSLKEWEMFLKKQEENIELLMTALIQHGSLPWLILFMAVVPGIAEELFFRGALQPQLMRLMNPHVAIWLTGFLFSAIHFQVYGFFPRAVLGVVMGYLSYYTGSLLPAMWAHFLNNAYATIIAYAGMHLLNHPEWMSSTYRPPIWVALIGAVIAGGTGFWLYRRLRRA